MKRQKIVYICSPLRGDLERNIAKANFYSRFAYEQGCIPIAPHAIFTQFLNDGNPNERKSGMAMGLELLDRCDELWAFGPLISDGMNSSHGRGSKCGKSRGYASAYRPYFSFRAAAQGQALAAHWNNAGRTLAARPASMVMAHSRILRFRRRRFPRRRRKAGRLPHVPERRARGREECRAPFLYL